MIGQDGPDARFAFPKRCERPVRRNIGHWLIDILHGSALPQRCCLSGMA